MSESGEKQEIRAGRAFMAAIEADPQARQSLAAALLKLRAFAECARAASASHRVAIQAIEQVLAAVDEVEKAAMAEQQRLIREGMSGLRVEQQRLFAELEREPKTSIDSVNDALEAHGFEPRANDLDSWEELARIVEKEPDPMTMEEIYHWAIAWAKRELLRRKMDREEMPIQKSGKEDAHPAIRSAEEAGIIRDEHDPTIAWCMGKRIYLGNDTQVSRLFWLLASPIGRARSLGEVQRAVDDMETTRDMDGTGEEYRKAGQRIRKVISKLRAEFRKAEVDDHLLIVRGGDADSPEYSMVLRFNAAR